MRRKKSVGYASFSSFCFGIHPPLNKLISINGYFLRAGAGENGQVKIVTKRVSYHEKKRCLIICWIEEPAERRKKKHWMASNYNS